MSQPWMTRVALYIVIASGTAIGSSAQQAAFTPLDAGRVTYSLASNGTGAGSRGTDAELATWAFKTWEGAARGALTFNEVPEEDAVIRVYWNSPSANQYGSMRPLTTNGRRAAAVYIQTDTDVLGDVGIEARDDALLRDTIVFLTCVHEIGHALGLEHTSDFADIMYSFGFGGDIPNYFGRYRARLKARTDIARLTVLSPGDVARLQVLYPKK